MHDTLPSTDTATPTAAGVAQAIAFAIELDKLKAVTRKTRTLHAGRYENSAEHSWQIALFAFALGDFAEAGTDLSRVAQMLLVHDVGEIDTGDTLVYVQDGWEERKAAERVAVGRIFGMAPASAARGFHALWEEFESGETREARFAHAIDRAMPALINLHNAGQSWRENDIAYARVVARIGPPIAEGCPALWEWMSARLAGAEAAGWYGMSARHAADVEASDTSPLPTTTTTSGAATPPAAQAADPAATPPAERAMYRNYLRFRDTDPTLGGLLARGGRAYALLLVVFCFAIAFAFGLGLPRAAACFAGALAGALLRDIGHYRLAVRAWPVLRRVLDWDTIARLAGDASPASAPAPAPGVPVPAPSPTPTPMPTAAAGPGR